MKTTELRNIYQGVTPKEWIRSKWGRGVQEYAYELLDKLCENHEETNKPMLKLQLLNGAKSWSEYSWGGCSLIYDEDIARRTATESEIKRRTYKNGQINSFANSQEQWLDVQAKALFQAYRRIREVLDIWSKI